MYEIVLSKIGDKLLDHFAGKIIRRWSQYRAKLFFHAFVEGLAAGKVNELEAIESVETALNNEAKSEILFDAYRRVCLSSSRETGPRFIGLLTARIVSEHRIADEYEERLFMAAEALSDSEFVSFVSFLRNSLDDNERELKSKGLIFTESHSEHDDSNSTNTHIDISPLNLGEWYGSWALKVASCGILLQRISQERQSYEEDSERHIDMDGVATTYTWLVGFEVEFLNYIDLLELASHVPSTSAELPQQNGPTSRG